MKHKPQWYIPQWCRDDKPIRGTKGMLNYTVTEKDIGKVISIEWVKDRIPRKKKKS